MPLDARTDLFSLGTVIYEMATGKTPFGGESTADVFVALLREDPPPVSTVNPAMPKQLDPIVAKLLAKDPAQRYASAEELQEDLEGLMSHASSPGGNAVSRQEAGPSGRGWLPRLVVAADCVWTRVVEVPAGATPAPARQKAAMSQAAAAPQANQGLDHPGGLRQPHRRSGL